MLAVAADQLDVGSEGPVETAIVGHHGRAGIQTVECSVVTKSGCILGLISRKRKEEICSLSLVLSLIPA